MVGRWMDERDRQWRARDGRRSEDARAGEADYGGEAYYGREDRSFDTEGQPFGARRSGPDRDRVFGEQETGASYARGGPGRYQDYRNLDYTAAGRDRPAWQERDYAGVSPAMEQGEYELENRRIRGRSPRFENQDYTQGGRYYGDDARNRIYREEYGQGGVEYGREPRGYDAGGQGSYGYRARPAYGGTASGGTGGYDYERGYGDGGRVRADPGGGADFLYRAGRKVREWFRGEDLIRPGPPEDPGYRTEAYRTETRRARDHRGLGPKGYKRSDERIGDEVNERLTDDSWLDASEVVVAVAAGEVTLTGSVESREAKHRAERIAEDVSGVAHVQNNLRVGGGNPLTTAGRGYGDSAAESLMRKDEPTANGSGASPGGNGISDDRL